LVNSPLVAAAFFLKEEGRRKKEEGRRKKEEGRRKREEGRGKQLTVDS